MSRLTAEAAVARMSEREKDFVALMVLRVVRELHLFYVKKPVRLPPSSPQAESGEVAA